MWNIFKVDMMVNLVTIQAPKMIIIFEGFFLSEWPVSGKTLVAVGTGVAAVVATPVLLAGAGFTAAGVAAGSIAAMLQVFNDIDWRRLITISFNLSSLL